MFFVVKLAKKQLRKSDNGFCLCCSLGASSPLSRHRHDFAKKLSSLMLSIG
jgi:hypothetical protein